MLFAQNCSEIVQKKCYELADLFTLLLYDSTEYDKVLEIGQNTLLCWLPIVTETLYVQN